MADVNANIGVNIDTSNALAQLKALQRQISQFHSSIAKSSETAALAQRDLQRNFLNGVNAIGAFSAELRTVKTTAESFTDALQKNKFSMREYFRYAGASTKTFGKLFSSEFSTINKVAEENVKRLQTQYIKMGRDASGAMRAIAIMPNELDMSKMSTQLQMAAQRQALFNQLVKQGSTNLLNFGKNTQWAGRQLMVGFTLPLATLGTTAARTFMEMEAAALKFRKVYGDLFTPREETQQALADITALGQMFTKYGVAISQTVGLAAEAAAAGFQGIDLQRQTAQATRLSVLGQIESQKALETTISLQNAFKMSSESLASSIDFLNAVENQTVVSLDDITTAIPKVAPVIQQLGGDVKDLAFFMAAMKEGGVNASEGANALKSGLASLINPTEKASELLAGMGINIKQIVETNKGDLKGTVIAFAQALDTLDPLTRARAIEQLFGKFQFARLSTLFDNVTNQTGQAARVLNLAGTSIEDLAALSEQELGMTADSAMNKFRKSVEDLKMALVPVGETFLQAVTPILEFIGGILEKFNNLSSGVKKAIVVLTVAIGAIGPVALMTFGLLANGLANIVKGALVLRQGYLRLTGQTQILGEQTEFLTVEQQRAAAVAHSLDQSHARLTQTFNAEAGAIRNLANEYRSALSALQQFAQRNPGMMMPPKKYNNGVVIVPGSGNKDTVPAMLTPGESVIPADMTKKYGALIQGMIAGNIPGFQKGRLGTARAHLTTPFAPGSAQFTQGIQMAGLQELASKYPQFIKVVSNLIAELPQSLNILLEHGTASIQEFSTKWSAATGKMLSSVKSGGGDINDPEIMAATDQVEQEIHDRTIALAQGTEEQTISDELLSQATRDVIEKYKGMSTALGKVTTALDNASQQVGQVRIQPRSTEPGVRNTDFIRAGLASGEFTQQGGNIFAGGVQIARESQSTPGKLRPASSFNPAGSYTRQPFRSQATETVDALINETARAAGTQSPSKRTIPIGEDIARGLEVGMQNRADDVARVGQNVAAGATRGISRGARTGGPVTPGTNFPVEKTRGGVPLTQVANAAIISEATKQSAEDMVKSAKSFQDRMTSLNRGLMSGTFALGSLSGLASMSGGKIGEFAGTVSKLNLAMFALMSVTQMLTQTQFTKLAADRLGLAQAAIANAHAAGAIKISGKSGLLGSFARLAIGIGKFLGPIGIITTAFMGAAAAFKFYQSNQEKTRLEIEGLGDAATLTKDKLKTLGDIFGVVPQTTKFETAGPQAQIAPQQRTQVQALRENEDFKKQFAKDIASLRKATEQEAALIFDALAVQLKGKGFAKEQVQAIVAALQEESGKTSIKFDFANIDLATDKGMMNFQGTLTKLSQDLGKQFSTGYSSEVKSAVSAATGEVVRWTEVNLSKGLKKNLNLTAKAFSSFMNGLSGQLENGTITADQFRTAFGRIGSTLGGMPQAQSLLVLDKIFKDLDPNLAKAVTGLDKVSNRILILRAQAVGLTANLGGVIEAFKTIANPKGDVSEKVFAGLKIDQFMKDLKAAEDAIAKFFEKQNKGTGTGTGGGDKSPFQLAIEQLQKQQKELINTQKAYAKLRAMGVETGRAFEIASDAILAAAIANDKLSTKQWEQLKTLIESVNKELLNSELLKFFEERTAELDLKKQFASIVPLLEKIGLSADDIKEIFSNPDLARAFIEDLKDGKINSEQLAKYIKEIPELKKIDIVLGISTDDAKEELRRKADELFGFLERAADREYKPKIIRAEKEVEAAQAAVDKVQTEIDGYERDIESLQRKTEIELSRPIEAFQEQIADLQRTIEISFERPIEALNEQINSIERQIEISFDRPIAGLQAEIEKMQRSIELGFERPIAALQEESSDLANELELMDRAVESINEKYDAQEEALKKISDINQDISEQQKTQLTIADALSQGDISAAARAAQEARAQAASAASERASGTIEATRQAQLEALRTRQGMTRVQVEQRQFQISQQVFALEEQREAVQAQILVKQDQIYALEQSRIPLQEQIRIKQDQIYAYQQAQKITQEQIRVIEDKIYTLEELREANLIQIRDLEDKVYAIKNGSLLTAQGQLKAAQDNLQVIKNELQARLDNINTQKDAWQAAADAEIAADIAAGKYNDVLTATVGLLKDIEQKWKDIAAAAAAASAGITGGTGKAVVTPGTQKGTTTDTTPAAVTAATKKADEAIAKADEKIAKADAANAAADEARQKSALASIKIAATTDAINDAVKDAVAVGASATNIANSMMVGLLNQKVDPALAASSARYTGQAIAAYQAQLAKQNPVAPKPVTSTVSGGGGGAGFYGAMQMLAKGGMVKPKYFNFGGFARGSDKIPAMLSPGEFIMSKYAVSNYGIDKLKAMNNGDSSAEGVYNYSINVNVKSGANPDEIARAVMTQIKQVDSQRIRGQRVS